MAEEKSGTWSIETEDDGSEKNDGSEKTEPQSQESTGPGHSEPVHFEDKDDKDGDEPFTSGSMIAGEKDETPDRKLSDGTSTTGVVPVTVNNATRRSVNDALQGGFVEITAGDHKGKLGAFTDVVDRDDSGYPKNVVVSIRDLTYDHDSVVVPYADVAPTAYNGGR